MQSQPRAQVFDRDRIEVERSAAEASKIVLLPVEVDRYLKPNPNTPHYLEYSFHLLGDVCGKTVLDLGCGSGQDLVPLVKRGATVIGIDISPDLIKIARKRAASYGISPRMEVGSAYETGLPGESVDVVFCMALLHHLDLPRARAEIRRVLRAGGRLILSEPIRFSSTVDRVRKLFPPSKSDISEFEHPLTRKELSLVIDGFEVIAQRNFRLPFVPLLARKFKASRRPVLFCDRWLLGHFPRLEKVATVKVMSLRKGGDQVVMGRTPKS